MFACTAQNQGPNSTSSGGTPKSTAFVGRAHARHASKADETQLQYVAIGEFRGDSPHLLAQRKIRGLTQHPPGGVRNRQRLGGTGTKDM
jgi:hypothetical protein